MDQGYEVEKESYRNQATWMSHVVCLQADSGSPQMLNAIRQLARMHMDNPEEEHWRAMGDWLDTLQAKMSLNFN